MSLTRYTATDLARFLDGGLAPVYVLDEDRRIIFCNAACASWLGLSVDALLGQQCNYHAPEQTHDGSSAEPYVAGLCPPPQVFSGRATAALVTCTRADGRAVHRRGQFLPLARGEDESSPVIAVLELADCTADAPQPDGESSERLHEQVRQFRQKMAGRFTPDRLIGNHPLIVRARTQIAAAAKSGASTLIVGPTGSGKDHAAKAIHYHQAAPGLLVPLDCALLEPNVLVSSLRTLVSRRGSRPANSTLLLENVGAMPPAVQAELLETLQADTLQMRLVATSSTSLAERITEGLLSPELVYALSTLVIELPPLAQRTEDLPLLVQSLVEEQNGKTFRQIGGFSSEALDQLAAYPWPGNLDELAAVVAEIHEKAQGSEVSVRDLPKAIHWGAEAAAHPPRVDEAIVLEEFLGRVEKELIARAMRRAKGNKSKAAKLLGLTRPRLYRRLVQLGLEEPK
jgi:transcriptional regulator with PAS, ATPase and Fis domain